MNNYSVILPRAVAQFLEDNNWSTYVRKQYPVKIQRADVRQVYNVPNLPGMVYNFLEDSYESVLNADYVITGLLGEMWPIPKESLSHYDVEDSQICQHPLLVHTKKSKDLYLGIQIPKEYPFTVSVEGMGVLNGNHIKVQHGNGDYIIKDVGGNRNFRIVNGMVFDRMYEKIKDI